MHKENNIIINSVLNYGFDIFFHETPLRLLSFIIMLEINLPNDKLV